jgi:hypothetical protein
MIRRRSVAGTRARMARRHGVVVADMASTDRLSLKMLSPDEGEQVA